MSYSALSDIEDPIRYTLCFSGTPKPINSEFLKREVLYNNDEHIVLKLWRLTAPNCFAICTYWNKKNLCVCSHFSGLLWFITLALQSSEQSLVSCKAAPLTVLLFAHYCPNSFFFIAPQIHWFHSNLCLMLISVEFIVGRIRVLVYSERNQLSQSIIALLFKQCLGPLKLKQTKKDFKNWFCTYGYLSFLFNRVFNEMAMAHRNNLLTFLFPWFSLLGQYSHFTVCPG